MKCRHCNTELVHTFIDLGSAPPSNSFVTKKNINKAEKRYPLKVKVCDNCWLLQTEDFVGVDEMFSEDYAYFSSFSSSWLKHAREYVETIVTRLHLDENSNVVEIAANDGYLLQYVQAHGIPCYGIEPTKSTAGAAREKGIEIVEDFFGVVLAEQLVKQERRVDLIIANNVLAHVPDINDFIKGCALLLKREGVATFEFPHLLNLVEQNQVDTIYHEHYSYLSLSSILSVFGTNGLTVFDVEELPTHGGSLRIFARRTGSHLNPTNDSVGELQLREEKAGVRSLEFYEGFQSRANQIKIDFLDFLVKLDRQNKKVAAYGAAAKGNTMLNFAGVKENLLPYVVDRNPTKLGKFLPGSLIPIKNEEYLQNDEPEYVVIFPWNLKTEIVNQLSYIREWNGKFVTLIPSLSIV